MFRRIVALASAVLLMSATPVMADRGGGNPADRVEYVVDESSLPFGPLAGFEDSERTWGVHKGAGYVIEVPADWNGDLIVWAHGFRGTDTALTISPGEVPLRSYALANGYAWAASSYSKNDYNVSTGVSTTPSNSSSSSSRSMASRVSPTSTGASMGGHVTAASIEKYPKLYDGAMPVCGVVGDYELFDYFLDFNSAAQQLALDESTLPGRRRTTRRPPRRTSSPRSRSSPGAWPIVLNETGRGAEAAHREPQRRRPTQLRRGVVLLELLPGIRLGNPRQLPVRSRHR